jgi:ABC-type bacteriocin/lantibiotic exporter with double-glycine peptidase domain
MPASGRSLEVRTMAMSESAAQHRSARDLLHFMVGILGPEAAFYRLAAIYGIGISLLSLATPISVQTLINTVANTGMTVSLVVLALALFGLLLLSALINALRVHLMDLFARRFYARMVADIALRSIYALNPFFRDRRMGALFNRYFDIVVVHKTLPQLLIGGFTVVLQAGVGFVLVSLYHPLFLVFNLVVVALIWLVWLIWGGRAIRSAIGVSHQKHATAAWLESLGDSNGFFKTERHIAEAVRRTNEATVGYLDQHARHFRHHFAQTICFLVLYAAASAALLGLGGWLVTQGQLSLGQLVAAELVLSVAFFGVSQLGAYLTYFYDLCAAVDELALFYEIEQEDPSGAVADLGKDAGLTLVDATCDARGETITLNFSIPSGARAMGVAATLGVQRGLTGLLRRQARPRGGYLAVGGIDTANVPPHVVRQRVIVLDRPNFTEMTVREYLDLSGDDDSAVRDLEVLKAVGLERAIARLDGGLDAHISSTGWPLTIVESMQLKLAAAIIAKPRILVLNQLFDGVPDAVMKRSLDMLQRDSATTVLYFSGRQRELGFDSYLYLGTREQRVLSSFDALAAAAARETDAAATGAPRPAAAAP